MSARRPRTRANFDWSEIRRRIEVFSSLEQRSHLEHQAVLEKRAQALARRPPAPEPAGRLEVVTFALSGERYAIGSKYVVEIGKFSDFTSIPRAPRHLLGVTNLRGTVLPVFDLGVLLALSGSGLTDRSQLLVLGREEPDLGIVADATEDVVSLRPGDILAPPDSLLAPARALLLGVTAQALIVVDGGSLLEDRRLFFEAPDPARAEGPARDT